MTLITNDEILRKYLPNAFSTAKGETALLDKLAPYLDAAEEWVKMNITSDKSFTTIKGYTDNNPTKSLTCQIVVGEAMRRAIPSLDLVLTPNGFGIVSNANIAPASKERVERLMTSLKSNRDDAIEQLLPLLIEASKFVGSEQYNFFYATLFPNLDLTTLCGYKVNRWEKYLELRSKVMDVENSLAEEYFSQELMAVLRSASVHDANNAVFASIIARIRPQIVDVVMGNPINHRTMIDIVNFIRNNPDEFPEWHSSDTAKLFSPPKFENKKDNKGYWF